MNIDKLFDAKLDFESREESNDLADSWQDMDIHEVADAFVALKECYNEAINRLHCFDDQVQWDDICFEVIEQ